MHGVLYHSALGYLLYFFVYSVELRDSCITVMVIHRCIPSEHHSLRAPPDLVLCLRRLGIFQHTRLLVVHLIVLKNLFSSTL